MSSFSQAAKCVLGPTMSSRYVHRPVNTADSIRVPALSVLIRGSPKSLVMARYRPVQAMAISADATSTAAPEAAEATPQRTGQRQRARSWSKSKKKRGKGGTSQSKQPAAQRDSGDVAAELDLSSILEQASDRESDHPAVLRRINQAIKMTRSLPAALKLVEDMAAAEIAPNEQTYVSLMLVCRRQRQAERALVVYEAMKAAQVAPSLLTFNLLLRCTAQARRRDDAMRIKQDMATYNVAPDDTTYTILMETLVKAGAHKGRQPPSKRVLEAFALFEEMKSSGHKPTTATYNILIEACALAQQVDQAMAVYLEMVSSDAQVDQKTFSLMMRCAGNSGRLQHALAVFGEMKAAAVAPNRDIYNHLIVACGNAPQPQVERAFEIFYEMQEEGRVQPDEVTFNALISAACKGGLPSYAFDAFDIMKSLHIKASLRTYNELIHAAGLRGIAGVEAAFEVYDAMRLAGELPDSVTFCSLIAACARARDAERAQQIFEEMLEVDCAPNLVVYHALISALGRAGMWREALDIYHTRLVGESASEGCSPTKATYSILFDACLGRDGAEAALAAAGGSSSSSSSLTSEGAAAAMDLYRHAVQEGMMAGAFGEVRAGEEVSTVRVDIRQHTRSAAIVGLLCVLADLKAAMRDESTNIGELVVMSGGRVRTTSAGPGRPSKLNLTAQALLNVMGLRCKPLSTLTVQALVVDKAAMSSWMEKAPALASGEPVSADTE